jgi:Ca-activated chloride channel family protein
MYALIAVPIIFGLLFLSLYVKERQLQKLASSGLLSRLVPFWSKNKEWIKIILFTLATAFLAAAWANPQWGSKKQKVKAKSSDIIIALDISQSMMAEDISPNRLERSKRMATQLIRSLRGERIGLIYFAGSAYLQMPLTNDYAAAEIFIKSANTNQAGTQGTAIADAIELGVSAFTDEKNSQKAMIIISDGENHDSEAVIAAREANEQGTFIYTIGVGTEKGAPVPVMNRGRKEYKIDKSGGTVNSSLNIAAMQDISAAGQGETYLLNQGDQLITDLKKELNKIEKKEVEQRSFSDYESYFQYFLFIGIILLLIEFLISNRRKNKILTE